MSGSPGSLRVAAVVVVAIALAYVGLGPRATPLPQDEDHIPAGIVIGTTACNERIYFAATHGWLFCDDGVWQYTLQDPAKFGGFERIDDAGGLGSTRGADAGASSSARADAE